MSEYMKPDDHEHSVSCDRCGKQTLDTDIHTDQYDNVICPDCAQGPKGVIIADITEEEGVSWFSDFGGEDHPTFQAKFDEARAIISAADTEVEMIANLKAAGFEVHDRRGVDIRTIIRESVN